MFISPQIVGVLNLSPDSFSDGKEYTEVELCERIRYLHISGSCIIDIGAESTAPGSKPISEEEEEKRLNIFFNIIEKFPHIVFSLDTTKANIAKIGISKGVQYINDVSAGRQDPNMFALIAGHPSVRYIIMYSKNISGRADGKENCSKLPIKDTVLQFFEERISAIKISGIQPKQIILDPGMGAFISTNYNDSVNILQNLQYFRRIFPYPFFIGTSRKGFLGKLAHDNGPQDRLGSSLASGIFAALQGVDFIRVHDVKETKQFIDCWNGLFS